VILIDTSAWVEFLRDTGSPVCRRVDDLLDGEIATCHPVRMEVLAGARDERHLDDLRRLLARASLLPVRATDFEHGAALFRSCRRNGETLHRIVGCLIAATAIRSGTPVLHADAEFDVLARYTDLPIDTGTG
jgi:predicted nucleic acid-binding protein